MLCLGVETSCDDTSLALVRDGELLAQTAASQVSVHALFGGVVPEVASREHARFIGPLCDQLLREAGVPPSAVDLVSVARGPGLLGSLLVGVAFAKAFALGSGARFLGVNHLHGHIYAAGLEQNIPLPALALLVSGGHTHIYRVDGPDRFTVLGVTLDDAAGEAFDKAGKMLGLPYPAGKLIDELADQGQAAPTLFPRPYLDNSNCDFSFSGLKTAMGAYLAVNKGIGATWSAHDGEPLLPTGPSFAVLADVCASYRHAIVETLAVKTARALALEGQGDVQTLILAGGVAANRLLRKRLHALAVEQGKNFVAPSPSLCTDNGAMIAFLGWQLASRGYYHSLDMEAIPRGRPVPDDMRIVGQGERDQGLF